MSGRGGDEGRGQESLVSLCLKYFYNPDLLHNILWHCAL